ncbi:MAG: class I SAM-dependent methyltransferase [Deltaproteobacteria bacterium]|nr:class I SAM-dependent methyltransferase [Deltaproteobacteria bacterium]
MSALAALTAALDAHASSTPLEPRVAARIDDLLRAMGAGDVLGGLSPEEARPLVAELRLWFGLDGKLMQPKGRVPGWTHSEPELLQTVGDFAVMHAHGLTRDIAPQLEGLTARLAAPDASFLDIGVGVAGTAIQMARNWPNLRIVGIDPWQPSLALARANVKQAGLADRIELREQLAEDLPDEAAFDLAWMPIVFMPQGVIAAACARTLRALRPGGWVVLTPSGFPPDPVGAAQIRLRMTMFGGPECTTGDVEQWLRGAGFADVRTLASPPASPVAPVVGRRPTS